MLNNFLLPLAVCHEQRRPPLVVFIDVHAPQLLVYASRSASPEEMSTLESTKMGALRNPLLRATPCSSHTSRIILSNIVHSRLRGQRLYVRGKHIYISCKHLWQTVNTLSQPASVLHTSILLPPLLDNLNMTTNPGGPEIVPLNLWTENHITAIYKATNRADFDKAFDEFIDKNAQITLNGRKIGREEYKLQLVGEKFFERSADVSFVGSVQREGKIVDYIQVSGLLSRAVSYLIPYEFKTGDVGVFFKATVFGRLFYRGAPVSSTVNSSINAV